MNEMYISQKKNKAYKNIYTNDPSCRTPLRKIIGQKIEKIYLQNTSNPVHLRLFNVLMFPVLLGKTAPIIS